MNASDHTAASPRAARSESVCRERHISSQQMETWKPLPRRPMSRYDRASSSVQRRDCRPRAGRPPGYRWHLLPSDAAGDDAHRRRRRAGPGGSKRRLPMTHITRLRPSPDVSTRAVRRHLTLAHVPSVDELLDGPPAAAGVTRSVLKTPPPLGGRQHGMKRDVLPANQLLIHLSCGCRCRTSAPEDAWRVIDQSELSAGF